MMSADLRNSMGGLDASVDEGFSQLTTQIETLRIDLQSRPHPEIKEEDLEDKNLLEDEEIRNEHLNEYLKATEECISTASKYFGSQAGSQADHPPSRHIAFGT